MGWPAHVRLAFGSVFAPFELDSKLNEPSLSIIGLARIMLEKLYIEF